MKKSLILLAVLYLLTACDITAILPGARIEVDGPAVASGSLNGGESARFEVYSGAADLRIDAADLDNGVAGSILLRVYDANNVLYAQTISRRYFISPKPEVAVENAVSQGVAVDVKYSINVPANSGMMHVEVTNMAATPTRVKVEAVSRTALPYTNDVFSPTPAGFNATTTGALVFLGQLDIWKYTGGGPASLTLAGGETVHATARVASGGVIVANLEPGESYAGLENGDLVFVQSQGNGATAGFCATLSGCNDGVDSGEYQLIITP